MEGDKTYINYHKILVLGPRGVGKTTLSTILKGNNFSPEYNPSDRKIWLKISHHNKENFV